MKSLSLAITSAALTLIALIPVVIVIVRALEQITALLAG